MLVNNIWSLTSDKRAARTATASSSRSSITTSKAASISRRAPILTVDWKADSSQQWTVPIGGGVGKIFHFGKLPVNTQISAYYNVVKPDFGANWQIRAQVQLMFPK